MNLADTLDSLHAGAPLQLAALELERDAGEEVGRVDVRYRKRRGGGVHLPLAVLRLAHRLAAAAVRAERKEAADGDVEALALAKPGLFLSERSDADRSRKREGSDLAARSRQLHDALLGARFPARCGGGHVLQEIHRGPRD